MLTNSGRTAPLTSKVAFYIFIQQIQVLNILNMVYTVRFFSLQNAVCFIILTYLVPVLFTFYIQGVLKLKKIIPTKKFKDNIMIHLLTAIGLTPAGSSTVHIYTQTVHRTTQLIQEECGPCLVFASYSLAFALQLRKKHGKNSVELWQGKRYKILSSQSKVSVLVNITGGVRYPYIRAGFSRREASFILTMDTVLTTLCIVIIHNCNEKTDTFL